MVLLLASCLELGGLVGSVVHSRRVDATIVGGPTLISVTDRLSAARTWSANLLVQRESSCVGEIMIGSLPWKVLGLREAKVRRSIDTLSALGTKLLMAL